MKEKGGPRAYEFWCNGFFIAACLSGCLLATFDPWSWQFGVTMLAACVAMSRQFYWADQAQYSTGKSSQ